MQKFLLNWLIKFPERLEQRVCARVWPIVGALLRAAACDLVSLRRAGEAEAVPVGGANYEFAPAIFSY